MFTRRQKYIFDLNDNCEMNEERKQISNPKRVIKSISHEYCTKTTIHGFQYIGEGRPWLEKLFWIFVLLFAIYCSSRLVQSLYTKWDETPVIVSFSEKSTPVWNIPFPAVTICSETKRILKTDGVSYARLYERLTSDIEANKTFRPENLTLQELDEFRTLLQICNTQIIVKGVPLMSTKKIDHCDILDQMLPNFERYFFYCRWFSHFGYCDELFSKTYTEEGICYTFNALNATDLYSEDTYQYRRIGFQNISKSTILANRTLEWSLENGYSEDSIVDTYPARVLAAGARAGLFIALQNFKQEIDYACRGPVQGYKVLLHSPEDVPLVSKQFVRIPMGKEVLVAVKPSMIITSAGIASYPSHRRQCFLNIERRLRFFKVYSQTNCELECLTNFTLYKCGCVKFSMPRTLDMPVCGEDKINCYDNAEDDLLRREFAEGVRGSSVNHRGYTRCNCLPACTSLIYNTEISQGNFDLEEMLLATGDTDYMVKYKGAQMSRLSVYFKEDQFITSKRSELYGVTDFLANCGGIFGLFMGFSMLSIVEIVYYFTLRLWSNINRASRG